MANPSGRKGTAAERAAATAVSKLLFPDADRRTQSGRYDKGDLLGTPGICFEVKNAVTWKIPEWMRETETERVNVGADYGILIVKVDGIGHPNAHRWLTVMDYAAMGALLEAALGARLPVHQLHLGVANSVKWVGLPALVKLEEDLAARGLPSGEVAAVNIKRRATQLEAGGGHWNLMRLDARCRVLSAAGYGTRNIME